MADFNLVHEIGNSEEREAPTQILKLTHDVGEQERYLGDSVWGGSSKWIARFQA